MKCVECQKEITKIMECVYKIHVDKPLCKECCENKKLHMVAEKILQRGDTMKCTICSLHFNTGLLCKSEKYKGLPICHKCCCKCPHYDKEKLRCNNGIIQ